MTERDLGDGLVMRWARPEDVERQVALTAEVFRQYPGGPPTIEAGPWGRDLGSGNHPHSGVDRLAIVEDVQRGIMVACIWSIAMPVIYDGIPLQVSRPEHVATHPDYRRRGLVGRLFTLIHGRSAVDGDIATMITGIPHFYRQFGYEYAIELGGGSIVERTAIHRHTGGADLRVRVATPDELGYARDLFAADRGACLVRNDFPESYWDWMHRGMNHDIGFGWQSLLVVDRDDQPVGAILMETRRWGRTVGVHGIAADGGVSLHGLLPAALAGIDEVAASLPTLPLATMPAYESVRFALGSGHPANHLLASLYGARRQPEDAWLVRVPDLQALLWRIAPSFERRLAVSPLRGHTGRLALDFYRGGLTLVFEQGALTGIEEGRPGPYLPDAVAGLPPGVILQLVFGRRTVAELRYILPDVWATPEAELLLGTLFPARPSHLLPVN